MGKKRRRKNYFALMIVSFIAAFIIMIAGFFVENAGRGVSGILFIAFAALMFAGVGFWVAMLANDGAFN